MRWAPYSICRRTIRRAVLLSRLVAGVRMTSEGMRYSNIDPDQESRAAPPPAAVTGRPSRTQCRVATSPLAMAVKLASRHSEASRS